ncbi:CDP-6-deoxy-D-xylo-4-hexulose-3-dehydrase [Alteromonadaceae bacterium 2753L.S.0a.02]|nr:CDP-6-deoxy-D-xylo-4-hexulose-3-dehydrase [Alteromonadaceae bacterium 2753L.S.0a.02]
MMVEYNLASNSWDDNELRAIQRVIASGSYTMGGEVSSYEVQFAQHFGSKFAVMTSSGSTANLLMIAALFYKSENPLKRGDEVIVPAVSWSTTYFPLQQYGLKVKFVDIDLDTLNIDIAALEGAISNDTRAIMLVNLLGNPNDMEKIFSLISDKEIYVLEDNCESMGAELNGKSLGTFGCMGTFSSFFSHHIATMEGGCVITDDEELYHILLCLRAHGWTRNLPVDNMVTGIKSSDPFQESFNFVLPGYNVRPLEMSGAIGQEQLKKLPSFVELRRENAEFFKNKFSDNSNISIQKEIGKSSWFGFSIILKKDLSMSRAEVIKHLTDNGVEVRPIVSGNFVKNTKVLEYFDYEVHGKLRNAEYLDENGFFVGNHHLRINSEIEYLSDLLTGLLA